MRLNHFKFAEGTLTKKYIGLLVMILMAFLTLSACGQPKGNQQGSSMEGTSERYQLSKDFCLKEGESADGEIVLKSSDFTGFGYKNDEAIGEQIIFYLTPDGSKIFSEKTKEFKGRTISVWLGEKLIASPTIDAQITGDSFVLSGNSVNFDVKDLINQLKTK